MTQRCVTAVGVISWGTRPPDVTKSQPGWLQIAVEVINDYGDEVMQVFEVARPN